MKKLWKAIEETIHSWNCKKLCLSEVGIEIAESRQHSYKV